MGAVSITVIQDGRSQVKKLVGPGGTMRELSEGRAAAQAFGEYGLPAINLRFTSKATDGAQRAGVLMENDQSGLRTLLEVAPYPEPPQ